MSKYNLSEFKKKITPRTPKEIQEKVVDRFSVADDRLGVAAPEEPVVKKSFARVVKKTFSIPENELELIEKIKDRALNRRIVLADSEILRLGLLLASELSDDNLEKRAGHLEKMQLGRPPKK